VTLTSAWIAALVMVSFGASACGSSTSSDGDAVTVASDAAYTGGPDGSSRDDNRLSQKTSRPLDPLAPSRIAPVERPGPEPSHRLAAQRVGFAHQLSYPDGVRIAVLDIRQAKVTGQGPGVLSGPMTSLRVQLVNGSGTTLDLDHVVVTTVYERPARIARPVYSDGTQDLAGLVKPGGRAMATYAFSVPTSDLTHVTVHIDFDSRHAAGVFSGSTASQS
jgi:hypothetical protein